VFRTDFPLFPEQASTLAKEVDSVFLFGLGVAVVFSLLIAALILFFAVRYRRRAEGDVGQPGHAPAVLEIVWSVVPLCILLFMFAWGARVFFHASRPPADAEEFFVVGRQWMWKFQHPEGHREINELHVPVGRPIKLTMTSEDVIHALYIPAFRIKQDVIPGTYTTTWFTATKPGVYKLFCAEYCGAEHSLMSGRIIVQQPQEYEQWLYGAKGQQGMSLTGAQLFDARACNTCHRPDSDARAPYLQGLFGRQVALLGGKTARADEDYLRESILMPASKVVAGYQPIMPTFKGQLTEQDVLELITYIKSLGSAGQAPAGREAAGGAAPGGKGR
jgi:cytochrome c oxidase subunit 2